MKRILEVPNVKQLESHCGPACLSMMLLYNGDTLSQPDIVDAMGLDEKSVLKDGVQDEHILYAAKRLGYMAAVFRNLRMEDITKLIDLDLPLITACRSGKGTDEGHYCVVKGYETNPKKRVFVNDPANQKRKQFEYKSFYNDWRWDSCSAIIVSKKRGRIPKAL